MKKFLTILLILVTCVSQGLAEQVETKLWEDTYSDGIELNSETVATFKAGDILRVHVTVPEGGANFKIVYKGASNGWAETTIPSIDNQWPWINGGETYKDFTLTDADITALAGMNIYIYQGENSTISKVSLLTESTSPSYEGTVIYNDGDVVMGTAWDKYIQLSADKFSSLNPDAVIRVYVKDILDDVQAVFQDGSWNNIEGVDAVYPAPTDTYYELTLTSSILAVVKENGLIVKGKNFTAVAVAIMSTGTPVTTYTLTITQPEAGGKIQKDGTDAVTAQYISGTVVTLTAVADEGYTFKKWSDGTNDLTAESDGSLIITMDGDKSVTAVFESTAIPAFSLDGFAAMTSTNTDTSADQTPTYDADTHLLTTTAGWTGIQLWIGAYSTYTGSKLVVRTEEACKLKVTVGYVGGGEVNLQDEAAAAVRAVDLDSSKKIEKVIIQNQEAGAVTFSEFALDPSYTLTITQPETGGSIKNGSETAVSANYAYGTEVTLTAAPSDGYAFSKWQQDGADLDVTVPTLAITITKAAAVTAVFSVSKSSKSLSTGSKKIVTNEGVSISKSLLTNISEGDILTVNISETAPEAAYELKSGGEGEAATNWQGLGSVSAGTDRFTYTFTAEDITKVKASGLFITGNGYTCGDITVETAGEVGEAGTHSDPLYTLTITQPEAGGKIQKDGTDAVTAQYISGTVVTLTAVADEGYTFKKWTKDGNDAGTEATLEVTMNSDAAVGAVFEQSIPAGVDITLDDLNEGWNSSYDAATKTITTTGEWGARGWKIGDGRYNGKGSITVKFNAVEFGVTLKMEYTNTDDEAKDVSAGAAAGETEVTLDIPEGVKTIDRVYITYQQAATLTLTEATVNDKVVDNRTEKTLTEKSQAISEGDIEINRGLFANAAAGDVLKVYAENLAEGSKIALEPSDFSGAFEGANWTAFTSSPFSLKLTATLLEIVKTKNLLVRGENFTFTKATLYTENELGAEIVPKYTLTIAEPENGTITIKKGDVVVPAGEFDAGTVLTLTAAANEGYTFTKWTDGNDNELSTTAEDKSLTMTMTGDMTVKAVFEVKDNRKEKVLLENVGGITCGNDNEGNTETIPGYKFSKAVAGDKLIVHVSAVSDNAYVSLKSPKTYTSLLSDYATPVGTDATEFSVTLTEELIGKLTDNGLAIYAKNLTIGQTTLFTENEIGTETDARYTLTVEAIHGSVSVSPASEDNRYAKDAELTISVANVDAGYEFLYWQKNGVDLAEKDQTLTIKMDGTAMTITAVIAEVDTDPTAVWKGDKEIGYFDTYVSGAEKQYLADVSQMDVICVYTKDVQSTAHYELQYKDGDGWNEYKTLQKDETSVPDMIQYTVDDADIAKLIADRGLVIKGEGFHVKKISLHKFEYKLINGNATEKTKQLFNMLKENYGTKIISGTVANVDWNTAEADQIFYWTGKYPAMNVFDFTNIHASKDVNSKGWLDYSDDTCVRNWSQAGGIVGAMWHWQMKANNGTDYTCSPGTGDKETSFDASQVYVDNTAENKIAKEQLNQVVGYLKKLQTADIPVIWRPFHEAAGNTCEYADGKAWFWWGAKGAEVYKKLWQWMYDYMVNEQGLNNLIWVWTSQTKDNEWYPGDEYVDIIGRDSYGTDATKLTADFNTLSTAYPNKMITLSEYGENHATMTSLSDMWNAGARWSWFMTWYNNGKENEPQHNQEGWWTDAFNQDYVITGTSESLPQQKLTEEETRTLWKNSNGTTLDWSKSVGRQSAIVGAILEKDEHIMISVKSKEVGEDIWPTIQLGNDTEKISSTATLLNDVTVPGTITIILTQEMVDKLKNGFAVTGDKVTITKVELYKPKTVNRTEHVINDTPVAMDGTNHLTVKSGRFNNASAYDILTVKFTNTSGATASSPDEEKMHLIIKCNGESDGWDYVKEMRFAGTETQFDLPLTEKAMTLLKNNGLCITGERYLLNAVSLWSAADLGPDVAKNSGGEGGDTPEPEPEPEKIIDSKTGEVATDAFQSMGDNATYNSGSGEMVTTEPWAGVQAWFSNPESVPEAANVLVVNIKETNTVVQVTVGYTDGTESQALSTVGSSKRRWNIARRAGTGGTDIIVPVDPCKMIQKIMIQAAEPGTITINSIYATVQPLFTDGKANLSMLKPQNGKVTYDTSTHTMATTAGWTGVTMTVTSGEAVSGVELYVRTTNPATMKLAVEYADDTQRDSIMSEAASIVKMPLDGTKKVKTVYIQPTTPAIIQFQEISVNTTPTPDIVNPVFVNGKADLSRLEVQDANRVMYNAESHKMVSTDGWVGVQLTTDKGEKVSGAELMVKFASPSTMKAVVNYSDGTHTDSIMSQSSTELKMALDNTVNISQIQLQPTEAAVVEFLEIAINQQVTPDVQPDPVFNTNGEADLSRLEVQDASRVMYNAESHKMVSTDGWVGVQLSTVKGEKASGAEVALQFAQPVSVKLSVIYDDDTQTDSIMEKVDTLLYLPVIKSKVIAQIQIQPTAPGVVEFVGITLNQELTPIPEPVIIRLFDEEGKGDLTIFETMGEKAVYDKENFVITTTEDWAGIQAWLDNPQTVEGNMISVRFAEEAANARIVVSYTDGTESAGDAGTTNATETGTEILVAHDSCKAIQKVMIQMPVAGTLTLTGISCINYTVSPLDVTEKRLLWKSSNGEILSWNEISRKNADFGSILEPGEMILVTIQSLVDGNEWPKVFIRDANADMVGEEMLLNSVRQFPYQAQFTLKEDMVAQMAEGFSICGDGIVVTRVELYKPEPPKEGDINLIALNGGWNSDYDAKTCTITTTTRWAARGWDIGDDRYNDKDVIIVRFMEVDFPVTLKMEYTDAEGRRKATSSGASASSTAVEVSIPENIKTIDKVYLIFQNPGSLTLTSAEVLTTEKEKVTLDLGSFEALGDNVTYDNKNYIMQSADAWAGIQLWLGGNTIEGGQSVCLTCIDADAKVRLTVGYSDGTEASVDGEGPSIEMELDDLRSIQKVMIQNQEAGSLQLKDITLTTRVIEQQVLSRPRYVNKNDKSWYSTSGSKIENPVNGLYIQKGKKIIIKK